jgi:hypothetical protein
MVDVLLPTIPPTICMALNAAKRYTSTMTTRTATGRFVKGVGGNPTGRAGGLWATSRIWRASTQPTL